ncbi:predicted protein [Histoplasma capsulatum H143]|uniref:Uncharacterized protein n=1 Tax=Ajellomyces capsulatus (strain H143) TaxID=544712 RepID=C6HIC7_AJECH|nr:predicted protein [Histoplasma capsulatum H143]
MERANCGQTKPGIFQSFMLRTVCNRLHTSWDEARKNGALDNYRKDEHRRICDVDNRCVRTYPFSLCGGACGIQSTASDSNSDFTMAHISSQSLCISFCSSTASYFTVTKLGLQGIIQGRGGGWRGKYESWTYGGPK